MTWIAFFLGVWLASWVVLATCAADGWEQAKAGIIWAALNAIAWTLILASVKGIFA